MPLWTPAQIATAAWWDFGDAASKTIATGISAIADKSGNGRTLAQATGGAQPADVASAINGLSVGRFDGSDDFLWNSSPILGNAAGGYMVFVLARVAGTNANGVVVAEGRSSTSTPLWKALVGDGVGTKQRITARNDAGSLYLNADLGAATVFANAVALHCTTDDLTTATGYLDGAALNTPQNSTRSGAMTLDRFSLGAWLHTSAIQHMAMDVGEVVIVSGAPDGPTRPLVEGYLAWTRRAPANPPARHPWASAAPTVAATLDSSGTFSTVATSAGLTAAEALDASNAFAAVTTSAALTAAEALAASAGFGPVANSAALTAALAMDAAGAFDTVTLSATMGSPLAERLMASAASFAAVTGAIRLGTARHIARPLAGRLAAAGPLSGRTATAHPLEVS